MFKKDRLLLTGAAALTLGTAGCGETIQERQAGFNPLCTADFSDYENAQRIWAYADLTIQREATGNFGTVNEQDLAQAALASGCTEEAMRGAADFSPDTYVPGTISEQLMYRGEKIQRAQRLMSENPTYFTRGLPVVETRRTE